MAMKVLHITLLVLFLSIGEIHTKTLLEKIQDDSDLSQVSSLLFCGFMVSFQILRPGDVQENKNKLLGFKRH